MSQTQKMLDYEADNWFQRNSQVLLPGKEMHLCSILNKVQITPQRILEVGCSNGHVLKSLKENFNCECYGIDPSSKAVEDGSENFPELNLKVGTAETLDFEDNFFDTIYLGFCLYLCERKDLFKIAYEVDRCLKDGGQVIVKDFYPPFPYKNPYTHGEDMFSYKMDHSKMFSWNPEYTTIYQEIFTHSGYEDVNNANERLAFTILRKLSEGSFPDNPYS